MKSKKLNYLTESSRRDDVESRLKALRTKLRIFVEEFGNSGADQLDNFFAGFVNGGGNSYIPPIQFPNTAALPMNEKMDMMTELNLIMDESSPRPNSPDTMSTPKMTDVMNELDQLI